MTKRRPAALDPRLLIGIGLVAASIAGVVGIVSATDETVQVFAAREALSPGDRVRTADLREISVRLDSSLDLYLTSDQVPEQGLVVTRAVAEGELLPASAVGSVDGVRLTSLVIEVGGALAASVRPASLVDVWASREQEGGFGPPAVIVAGAGVVRLVESDSMVTGGETTAVEILVPKARVARVLEALANDDALSIVPASTPAR